MWTVLTLFRGRVVYATCHADEEAALSQGRKEEAPERSANYLQQLWEFVNKEVRNFLNNPAVSIAKGLGIDGPEAEQADALAKILAQMGMRGFLRGFGG
jgi:hypothetical protein